MLLANIDASIFQSIVALLLGGGLVTAWSTFRKTPSEIESISVGSLSTALTGLQEEIHRKDKDYNAEIARKDRQITELRRQVDELRERVLTLETA